MKPEADFLTKTTKKTYSESLDVNALVHIFLLFILVPDEGLSRSIQKCLKKTMMCKC